MIKRADQNESVVSRRPRHGNRVNLRGLLGSSVETLRRELALFRRGTSGAGVLEFAFAAPIMIMVVIGIMEVSMIFFASTLLEGGLREAVRFGITGTQPNGVSREERIVEIINDHGNGLITITADDVTMLVYSDFEDIGEPEPYADENTNGEYDFGEPFTDVNCNGGWDEDMGASGAGNSGDVVLYRVTHDWSPLLGVIAPFIGNEGKVSLSAGVAVRNEPSSESSPSC